MTPASNEGGDQLLAVTGDLAAPANLLCNFPADTVPDAEQEKPKAVCAVCIVTYNSQDAVGLLLTSLASGAVPIAIRVIDNASSDHTVEVICRLRDDLGLDLSLEASPVNGGFPVACNRLLRQCREPVIAVVNPDVELTNGALERLIGAVTADMAVGIATCRLMTREGRAQTAPARPRPRLRHLVLRDTSRRLAEFAHVRKQDPLFSDRDVECMSGAFMVFRRSLLDEIGYLDQSVFMFLEDIDFAARVRRACYQIRYFGTSWAWHDCGGSTSRHDARLEALAPRVWINYLSRYGSRFERWVVRPFMFSLATAKAIRRLAAAESPAGQLEAMWGALVYRSKGVDG